MSAKEMSGKAVRPRPILWFYLCYIMRTPLLTQKNLLYHVFGYRKCWHLGEPILTWTLLTSDSENAEAGLYSRQRW